MNDLFSLGKRAKKSASAKKASARKAARSSSAGKVKHFPKTEKGCKKRKMSFNKKTKRCNLKK